MNKSPAMYKMILGGWGLALLYFNPRFLALLIGPEPLLAKGELLLFVLLSNLFWFYTCYHLVIVGCSYTLARARLSHRNGMEAPSQSSPAVALLYTTCNDFQEEATRAHLSLNYPAYHLFICDDSSRSEYRLRIDAFAQRYPAQVTVLRRGARIGFKAGNVNHALRRIGHDYAYFSISDADTILPPNYIQALLPVVMQPQVAFAQARQASPSTSPTRFAQWLTAMTDLHYRHYAATKNRFGFVMFYGHGALMRTDVWQVAGGFPEIATEDLAYSMRVRQLGYEGVFVPEVVCREEFPPTYRQYRKRNEKWIKGTMECLGRYATSFLQAPHIPWVEKLDCLISAGSLLLSLPFMVLLLLAGACLPLSFTALHAQGPMLRLPVAPQSLVAGLVHLHGNLFWSWDVYGLMLATIMAPLVPALVDLARHPLRMFQYLAAYLHTFFAVQMVSALHMVGFLVTSQAPFPVTGDVGPDVTVSIRRQPLRTWLASSHANERGVFAAELLVGLLCALLSSTTNNVWFVALAMALVTSPLIAQWNFNTPFTRALIWVPLVLTSLIVLLVGGNLP